jgi:hypothetical protein
MVSRMWFPDIDLRRQARILSRRVDEPQRLALGSYRLIWRIHQLGTTAWMRRSISFMSSSPLARSAMLYSAARSLAALALDHISARVAHALLAFAPACVAARSGVLGDEPQQGAVLLA